MDVRASSPEVAFAKALRSFQTGGINNTDLLAQVELSLNGGASPVALREALERRESIEPLPDSVRRAIMALLDPTATYDTIPDVPPSLVQELGLTLPIPPSEPIVALEPPTAPPAEAATIILDDADSDPLPAAADPSEFPNPGDLLGDRFRLQEVLGDGGLSRVYKATDTKPVPQTAPTEIALKVLTRPFGEHAEAFSALQEEVGRLQTLSHPNIVRMFGCWQDLSTVFITMEYLPGASLYSKLNMGDSAGTVRGLPRVEADEIIDAVAGALEYAHAREVVHGDLKPGNVIVLDNVVTESDRSAASGRIKVIDFGMTGWIGRSTLLNAGREPRQGRSAVTPRYASPQLMARQKPDVTDDVYAFACMVYEVLTGVHPFHGSPGAQAADMPPSLHPALGANEYAAVVHGLKRERRQRTATIQQFMEEFRQPIASAPAVARRSGALWAVAAILAAGGWYLYVLSRGPGVVTAPPSTPATASTTRATSLPVSPRVPAPAQSATRSAAAALAPAPVSPPRVDRAPLAATIPSPGTTLRDCPTCPLMSVLPPGHFVQGTSAKGTTSRFEQPAHREAIAAPLAMGVSDITVGDFKSFVAATHRDMRSCEVYTGQWQVVRSADWQHPGFAQTRDHPVTCTSWDDAIAYTKWLSAKTNHRYRLPSAAEWEYAARAGATASAGDATGSQACTTANVADQSAARQYPGWAVFPCSDGYVHTSPAGAFKSNAFGLNDMLGNVFQWTQDCWHPDYTGAPADGTARIDGDCTERELRGGSWFSTPAYVRPAYRNHFPASTRTSSAGFRVVRDLVP